MSFFLRKNVKLFKGKKNTQQNVVWGKFTKTVHIFVSICCLQLPDASYTIAKNTQNVALY